MNGNHKPRRERSSVAVPLILIGLGVILLLRNLGVITGDVWSLLWRLWPVLLLAFGLDSLLKREGVVGPVLTIGLGVVFLLSNFNFLNVDVWRILLRAWPVFLIAFGFDLVIRSRSGWALALGAVVGLVLLAGAVWLSGVRWAGGQTAAATTIRQSLGEAQSAHVTIAPGAAALLLAASHEPGILLVGGVPAAREGSVREQFALEGDVAVYELRDVGGPFFFNPARQDGLTWDLQLNDTIPLELMVNLGAGDAQMDLSGLQLDALQVDLGVGAVRLSLPDRGGLTADLNSGIGQLTILVPSGVGVRIELDTGIGNLDLPSGYVQRDGAYLSPQWETASDGITLLVSQGIGEIRVIVEE